MRRCPPGWKIIKKDAKVRSATENSVPCMTGVKLLCEREDPRTVEECMFTE